MTDSAPPQNEEAEVSVLGAILLSDRALGPVLESGLRPGHFYRRRNQLVFRAMERLHERERPVDVLTVCEELRRHGVESDAGGSAYVHSLPNLVPAAGNVATYARILREFAHLRELLDAARDMQAAVFAHDWPGIEAARRRMDAGPRVEPRPGQLDLLEEIRDAIRGLRG